MEDKRNRARVISQVTTKATFPSGSISHVTYSSCVYDDGSSVLIIRTNKLVTKDELQVHLNQDWRLIRVFKDKFIVTNKLALMEDAFLGAMNLLFEKE